MLTYDQHADMINIMWSVTAKEEKKLLLIRSDSTLDFFTIQEVLYHIYMKNEGRYSSYNRLIDLSDLTDFNTCFDSIRDLVKSYGELNPLENKVKIAVYIPFGITKAILEVYFQQENPKTNRYLVSGSFNKCVHFLSTENKHRNISEYSHTNCLRPQSFD